MAGERSDGYGRDDGATQREQLDEDNENTGATEKKKRRLTAGKALGLAAVTAGAVAGAIVAGKASGLIDDFRGMIAPPVATGESFSETQVLDLRRINEICSTEMTFAHDSETAATVPLPGIIPDLNTRVRLSGVGAATVCTPVAEMGPNGEVIREYITAVRDNTTDSLTVTVDMAGTTVTPRWREGQTRVAFEDGSMKDLAEAGANAAAAVPFVDRLVDLDNMERTLNGLQADMTAEVRQRGLQDVVESCEPQLDRHIAPGVRDAVYAMAGGFGVPPERTRVELTSSESPDDGTPFEAVDYKIDYGDDALDGDQYAPRPITGGHYQLGEFTSGARNCEVQAEN